MTRHLAKCPVRAERIQAAANQRASETLYYLRAQDAYNSGFWLDLEVPGSATLKHLDTYLRGIWLECCGHLSRFSVGGWGSGEIGVSRKIGAVFAEGVELTHIYDFGTSSETRIAFVSTRTAVALTTKSTKPVTLMARNVLPPEVCMKCDQQATHLCVECMYEMELSGFLCDTHTAGHPHDNYGEPLPLVNSPRLGMCGYDGPAEPPYS